MALAGKIAVQTGIQVGAKIITTVLSLIALALTTRYLGQYGFGQYTTAISWVTFFSIAADLGITLVTAQLLSQKGADIKKVLSNVFTFRLVSGFLIIGLAPIIILFSPYEAIVKQGALVAAIAFYFVILGQVFVSFFQRELRTDRLAIAEVSGRILFLIATWWAIQTNVGIMALLWILTAANGVTFVIQYIYARRRVSFGFAYDKIIWQDILQRSWPLVITIILNLVYLKADILILSFFHSQAAVGLYGAAYRVIDTLVTIPFLIGGTVLPILATRWQANNPELFQKMWQKIFDMSAVIAWPLVIGGFILATPIMRLISGDEFEPAGPILKILIFGVGFIFFSSFFGYTMISFNQQKRLIMVYLITAVTSLAFYFFFIPRFSYTAAAWITVYSEVIMCLFAWRVVRRSSGLRISFPRFFKAFLAALVMGIVISLPLFVWQTIPGLLITIIIGALVYGSVLYLLKGISKEDILELVPDNQRV